MSRDSYEQAVERLLAAMELARMTLGYGAGLKESEANGQTVWGRLTAAVDGYDRATKGPVDRGDGDS